MLAKCTNPSCFASFRNLKGRLFRLEASPELTPCVNSYGSNSTKVEYFWLCSRCSEFMALRLGQDGTVVTVSIPRPCPPHSRGFLRHLSTQRQTPEKRHFCPADAG